MKRKNQFLSSVLLFVFVFLIVISNVSAQQKKNVKNPPSSYTPMTSAEIDQKVQELLSKMTIEEKVGQMTLVNLNVIAVNGWANKDGALDPKLLKTVLVDHKVGNVLNALGHAYTPQLWYQVIGQIQDVSKETPNKIPVLYGIDAIHGTTFTLNSTLFPHSIGMSATRNTEMSRLTGEITAKETRASGIRWNYAPVLDVARTPLWSRFEETYGEDPYLVTEMGVANIKGMEGDGNLMRNDRVASCMKHYLGYGWAASGKDRTPAFIPDRQLREIFLPPFAAAIKAGSHTLMINSSEINGIPVHADKYLLTDVLKVELGFKGVACTDWEDIIRLHTKHKVAPTMKDAVMMAINAGVDMSMIPSDDYMQNFIAPLLELVKEGKVSEARINDAVGRILRLKFELGLFQNPYPEKDALRNFKLPQYKTAALEAARESMTLLKNDGNILPLSKDKKVLVTGPGAKSITSLNGSWSYTWQGDLAEFYPDSTAYVLNAIKSKVKPGNVVYRKGAGFYNESVNIQDAVEAAKSVDYIILCIGEDAYAESPGVIDDLVITETQSNLAKALYQTGKPVIIVLTEGRPRIIREIEGGAKGIILAYVPGSQGHNAIADVLFGDYNPSGKLPYSYPRFSGDLVPYDHKYSDRVNELQPGVFGTGGYKPQWPFGFGLSYSKIEYSNLRVNSKSLKGNGTIKVSVDVKNSGDRAAKEAVELYTRDHYASVTPAQQKLRKFKKISLNPGQTITVDFELNKSDLAFVGLDSKTWVTEPGAFDAMVGGLKVEFNYEE